MKTEDATSVEPWFGRTVRVLRIQRRWTQEQLGERLGLDDSAVARLEKGQRGIRLGEAYAIATLFGVALGDFLPPLGDDPA